MNVIWPLRIAFIFVNVSSYISLTYAQVPIHLQLQQMQQQQQWNQMQQQQQMWEMQNQSAAMMSQMQQQQQIQEYRAAGCPSHVQPQYCDSYLTGAAVGTIGVAVGSLLKAIFGGDSQRSSEETPQNAAQDYVSQPRVSPTRNLEDDALANAKKNLALGTNAITSKQWNDAFRYFLIAADGGLPQAQAAVGLFYEHGVAVTKDFTEAVRWYRKAAEQQNPIAESRLGHMYANGSGVAKDETEAVRLFRKAADKGDASAQYELGRLYISGQGVTADVIEATKFFRKSADQGNTRAMVVLGMAYAVGIGVNKDASEAASWYRKAADKNSVLAQYELGRMYSWGRGVPQSDTEAFLMYSKSAEGGHPPAMVALGSMYEQGKGTAKDASKAFELYKKASDLGAAAGYFALARAYGSGGLGVEKNLTEAGNLLRKAADMGYEAAQVTLGTQYMRGSGGMSKNQEEAILWFKKAAAKNYPSAHYQLGAAYEAGSGVALDIGTARDYYTKAAKGGLKDAEVALSRMKSQDENLRALELSSGDKNDQEKCERFAAFEDSPERGIRKAYSGFIDVDRALPPCIAFYKRNPKNTKVQAQLARIYMQQGKFEEAVELARSAAKEQRVAFVTLASAHSKGLGGVQIDLTEAAKLLRQGVDRGDPEAMSDLGIAYAQGKGVEKDEQRGLDLVQRAADMGDLEAIYVLANSRFSGRWGAQKNVDEALRLMQKSADNGYPVAQLRLGMILATREKRMTPEAYRYVSSAREQLQRFADQGSAWARTDLGEIYERGVGVPKDPAKAFALYRMAASHGYGPGMTRLGVAYLEGIGTDKNPTEGRQWLEKAAKIGSEAAEKKLRASSGG